MGREISLIDVKQFSIIQDTEMNLTNLALSKHFKTHKSTWHITLVDANFLQLQPEDDSGDKLAVKVWYILCSLNIENYIVGWQKG